jgi:hypothetical protein
MSYNLDRAEQVLQSAAAGRRDSETWFLQALLREIDPEALLGMSPAQLFQHFLRGGKASERMRRILAIVARPFEQPDQPLRPGDVMLRATPGAGDIGHVMVLVSSELRTPSALAADGVTAESTAPGQYGTVIEAGAFPHDRSAPYARRWLDGRGRVPPNSLILRPSASPDDPYLDFPAGGPAQEADDAEALSTPGWLRSERRSADRGTLSGADSSAEHDSEALEERVADQARGVPSWLKSERRRQIRSTATGLEAYGEDFTFDPTGAQTDFGPRLRKLWHKMLKDRFEAKVARATSEIKNGLGITPADAAKQVRFFSQGSRPASVALSAANVSWRALPSRKGPPSHTIYEYFDKSHMDPIDGKMLRDQDEYCEWKVFTEGSGKILRVVFTSEPPEYYHFLYDPTDVDPGAADLVKFTRGLLVRLYQERCGTKSIILADLETTGTPKEYDPGNKWNNECCVHLQQPENTLIAQIDIAARASVVRSSSGSVITDVKTLIGCDPFGRPERQSDPTIGDNVNKLARQNRFLTLANPVGLYMSALDTSGWTTPDGTDPQTFWKVLKGTADKDPHKSMIVRAEFVVPASKKYTVSDITIGGVPIEFGSQIAEQLEMRLGALYGPVDKDPEGHTTSAPTPVPC